MCPDFFPSFSSLIAELEGTSFPCSLTALCCSCPAFFLSDCCSLRLPLPLLHLPHFCLYKEALLALWEKPPPFSLGFSPPKKSTRALLLLLPLLSLYPRGPLGPYLALLLLSSFVPSFAISSPLGHYLPLFRLGIFLRDKRAPAPGGTGAYSLGP